MKKPPRLGLVVEGKLTNSSILRCQGIVDQLGPVKAKTLRVARRATNFLRAGSPTDSFDAFEETPLVLIHVPPSSESEQIRELADADLLHAAKTFVLCESWASSSALEPLARRGSGVITSVSIATADGRSFVLEGKAPTMRSFRALLGTGPERVITIREGQKELLFATELLAGVFPLALMGRAEEASRAAGITGRQMRLLLDGIARRMLLDAANPTHGAVRSPLRGCPPHVAQEHFRQLQKKRPELAGYLRHFMEATPLSELLPQSAKLEEDEQQAVSVEIERA